MYMSLVDMFSLLWGVYLEVELLGHMLTARLLRNVREDPVSHFLGLFWFWVYDTTVVSVKRCSMDLMCFLEIKHVGHLLLGLISISTNVCSSSLSIWGAIWL